MLDLFEGAIKGIGLILRMCVEGGLWDLSIHRPGHHLLKAVWPPYWFREAPRDGVVVTLAGIVFWLALAYGFFAIDRALQSG